VHNNNNDIARRRRMAAATPAERIKDNIIITLMWLFGVSEVHCTLTSSRQTRKPYYTLMHGAKTVTGDVDLFVTVVIVVCKIKMTTDVIAAVGRRVYLGNINVVHS